MAKNKRKKSKKMFFISLFCLFLNAIIIYSIASTFQSVYYKNKEKQELSDKLVSLKELRVEANRLQDPEYVARYAREKFFYSGKNEYVIRMP